ncbi:hypothetical protein ARMGADRAFT_1093246 [Armillaria gallica]|uniref:Uncharacterized protein n=1 Tax=Armillaria gallica TaxID=47427 RepID=A0A2H3C8D8_ARMGA|nr:hypothetical protein ARMGADRAFT_1093246 [Armillaria gallica]
MLSFQASSRASSRTLSRSMPASCGHTPTVTRSNALQSDNEDADVEVMVKTVMTVTTSRHRHSAMLQLQPASPTPFVSQAHLPSCHSSAPGTPHSVHGQGKASCANSPSVPSSPYTASPLPITPPIKIEHASPFLMPMSRAPPLHFPTSMPTGSPTKHQSHCTVESVIDSVVDDSPRYYIRHPDKIPWPKYQHPPPKKWYTVSVRQDVGVYSDWYRFFYDLLHLN